MNGNIVKLSLALLFSIIAVEHYGNLNGTYRPSTTLAVIANKAQDLFELLGNQIARVSAFITWLKIDRLAESLLALLAPLLHLFLSWWWVIVGFAEEASKHVHPEYVWFGFSCILAMLIGIAVKQGYIGKVRFLTIARWVGFGLLLLATPIAFIAVVLFMIK